MEALASLDARNMASEEKQSQTVKTLEAGASRLFPEAVKKFVNAGLWRENDGGRPGTIFHHPPVTQAIEERTSKKGGIWQKGEELRKAAADKLTPLFRKAAPDGQPPSGKTWEDVTEDVRKLHYEDIKAEHAKRDKQYSEPFDATWTTIVFEAWKHFGPTGLNHVCFRPVKASVDEAPNDAGEGYNTGRQAQRSDAQKAKLDLVNNKRGHEPMSEMLAVVKGFSATSNEVKTQRALSARASYLDIILKHAGPDTDIGKACLEELMDMASKKPKLIPVEDDDEVIVMPSPPQATAPSARTSSPPAGDDGSARTSSPPAGDDGLTANQRIVLQVFRDDECSRSPNGFSAEFSLV